MQADFTLSLPRVLKYEGGFTADRRDPGNWTGGKIGVGVLKGTKLGVSAAAFPNLDIKNLTVEAVGPIYKKRYWDAIAGDELPAGIDFITFDGAVNSGPRQGVKWTQRAIAKMGEKVPVDGDLGPLTVEAAKRIQNVADLVRLACKFRLSFLQALRIWKTFGKGWASRVADVEVFGVKLAMQRAGATPEVIRKDADAQAAAAKATVAKSNAAAGGSASGGAIVTGTTSHDPTVWLIVGAVIALLVVFMLVRAHVQRQRATAYLTAAATT